MGMYLNEFINEEWLKYPEKKWGKHTLQLHCEEGYDSLKFVVNCNCGCEVSNSEDIGINPKISFIEELADESSAWDECKKDIFYKCEHENKIKEWQEDEITFFECLDCNFLGEKSFFPGDGKEYYDIQEELYG